MLKSVGSFAARIVSRRYSNAGDATFHLLNLKIGYTANVKDHPNSDKMFISQIQLSQPNPTLTKQVCSGLRDFIARDQFENQLVIVVDNMKKCKLRGEVSEAMVLCGDDSNGNVQPCRPAVFDTTLIGCQVVLKGEQSQAATTRRIKTAEWLDISSRLYVNDQNEAIYYDPVAQEERVLCVYHENKAIPIVVDNLPERSPIR